MNKVLQGNVRDLRQGGAGDMPPPRRYQNTLEQRIEELEKWTAKLERRLERLEKNQ